MKAIPEEFLKSVMFLCSKNADMDYKLKGTAFLVSVRSDNGMMLHRYVVTTQHILADLQRKGHDAVYLRVNYSSQRPPDPHVRTLLSNWWPHPTDLAADVAVFPVPRFPPGTDHLHIPAEDYFLRDNVARTRNLSIGDEVFSTGLFEPRPGISRNIPIVRVGNIAAMPGELIEQEDGSFMTAYLVESRSLGGLSGSPVFAFFDNTPRPVGSQMSLVLPHPEYYVLGVDSGHWDEHEEGVNMGIAIVSPIEKVTDVLKRPELIAMRKEVEQQAKKKNLPKKDSASMQESPPELTTEEFEAILAKASRKLSQRPSEPDQGKPRT